MRSTKIKVEKRQHKLFSKWRKSGFRLKQIVGRWQYIYSSKKGVISLVKLLDYFREGKHLWEIYCVKGNLLDDVERFDTKKEAEVRIKELLE